MKQTQHHIQGSYWQYARNAHWLTGVVTNISSMLGDNKKDSKLSIWTSVWHYLLWIYRWKEIRNIATRKTQGNHHTSVINTASLLSGSLCLLLSSSPLPPPGFQDLFYNSLGRKNLFSQVNKLPKSVWKGKLVMSIWKEFSYIWKEAEYFSEESIVYIRGLMMVQGNKFKY